LIVLGTFAAAVVVALQSYQGREFQQFVQTSRIELRKVVWPNRQETWQVTLLVFAVLIIMALFFWGLDQLLGLLTKWLTGRGA
jgi:preprotein translocase subunit SecE